MRPLNVNGVHEASVVVCGLIRQGKSGSIMSMSRMNF